MPHDILLGRWRLALDLFGRVFVDDVGLEPGSIISELGGFPVKVNSNNINSVNRFSFDHDHQA